MQHNLKIQIVWQISEGGVRILVEKLLWKGIVCLVTEIVYSNCVGLGILASRDGKNWERVILFLQLWRMRSNGWRFFIWFLVVSGDTTQTILLLHALSNTEKKNMHHIKYAFLIVIHFTIVICKNKPKLLAISAPESKNDTSHVQ